MHVWLEVSSTGGALGPRRSTRQHFLRSAWRLLQRGSRVWCWEQRCDRHKFLTFAIGRAFRKELMLVFSKRLSTVALFQVLNNLDSVQNYVSPANVTLVICQPDELSAELSVKPLVFGETEFMLASNVIFQLTEEHCLVTIATEGLNSILHIVAEVFMHLIVSPLACFLQVWRRSFVGLDVHDKKLLLSFFNLLDYQGKHHRLDSSYEAGDVTKVDKQLCIYQAWPWCAASEASRMCSTFFNPGSSLTTLQCKFLRSNEEWSHLVKSTITNFKKTWGHLDHLFYLACALVE